MWRTSFCKWFLFSVVDEQKTKLTELKLFNQNMWGLVEFCVMWSLHPWLGLWYLIITSSSSPHHLLCYKVQVFIPALATVKQNSASSASFIFALLLSFWWQFGHNRVHNITIEKQWAFCTCRLHLMFVLQEQTLLYL